MYIYIYSIYLQYKPSQCVAHIPHTGVPCTVWKENPRDIYCAHTPTKDLCQRPGSLFLMLWTSFFVVVFSFFFKSSQDIQSMEAAPTAAGVEAQASCAPNTKPEISRTLCPAG